MTLLVLFWILFAVNVALVVGGVLDKSGDHATRGLARAFALGWLPFLAGGLLLFLFARSPGLRLAAALVLGFPFLLAAALWLLTSLKHGSDAARNKAFFQFPSSKGRALGEAIERNDLPKIRGLVSQGADPNAAGRGGETPLWFAMKTSKIEAAVLLVELGADPNRGPKGEETALVTAAGRDAYSDVLKAALARGADPNTVSVAWPAPLLFEALKFNARGNVGILIESGARLDIRNDNGRSALSQAILLRMWNEARRMLERGVTVDEPPGIESLKEILGSFVPPDAGTPERAEFDRFAEALAARGVAWPTR